MEGLPRDPPSLLGSSFPLPGTFFPFSSGFTFFLQDLPSFLRGLAFQAGGSGRSHLPPQFLFATSRNLLLPSSPILSLFGTSSRNLFLPSSPSVFCLVLLLEIYLILSLLLFRSLFGTSSRNLLLPSSPILVCYSTSPLETPQVSPTVSLVSVYHYLLSSLQSKVLIMVGTPSLLNLILTCVGAAEKSRREPQHPP